MTYLAINNLVVARHECLHAERSSMRVEYEPSKVADAITGHVGKNHDSGRSGYEDAADTSQVMTKMIEVLKQFVAQLQSLLPVTDKTVTPHVKTLVTPMPDPRLEPLPDLSAKRNGAKADDIWGGFRQGPDGNCVTVSAIKAAMVKFGQSPTDIYQGVKKLADGYGVTMRDGFSLTLSKQELAEGIRGARFVGRDKEMLKDAHFLFAVSAKRAQMENNDGTAKRSYSAAVRSLNNGEDERGAGEGFLRLGLKQHMKKVPVSELAKGTLGMINRMGHSVAVINGIEELYGKKGGAPKRGDAIALV